LGWGIGIWDLGNLFITFCCYLARDWSWVWLKVDLSWPCTGCWLTAAELYLASVCVCRLPSADRTLRPLPRRHARELDCPPPTVALPWARGRQPAPIRCSAAMSLLDKMLQRLRCCRVRSSTTRSRGERRRIDRECRAGGRRLASRRRPDYFGLFFALVGFLLGQELGH
jgi:hypothetical protein